MDFVFCSFLHPGTNATQPSLLQLYGQPDNGSVCSPNYSFKNTLEILDPVHFHIKCTTNFSVSTKTSQDCSGDNLQPLDRWRRTEVFKKGILAMSAVSVFLHLFIFSKLLNQFWVDRSYTSPIRFNVISWYLVFQLQRFLLGGICP